MATALAALMSLPTITLAPEPTPLQRLSRLEATLGRDVPKLFIKRDDLLSFAFGGNKVRKLQAVAAEAQASGADTLVTCGGVQSNHARVTAATGSALGMRVVLVLNGVPPARATGNLLLDELFGADVRFVDSPDQRASKMNGVAAELRQSGRHPFVVPLGASTATGALGFARGVAEVAATAVRPTMIVHATSSGGTQAGLIAGCTLFGLQTRIIGVSADAPAESIQATVADLLASMAERLGAARPSVAGDRPIDVDDRFVGDGYGIPTPASSEAVELLARTEGITLDPVYTAKAMAGAIARIRSGEFMKDQTILFWHTGGTPALFA